MSFNLRNALSNAFVGGGGGGGAATWGTITGTLSAQTDLQAALDAKLNLTGGTLTGQLINSTNGAASTPPVLLSGTIFGGNSAPAHLIQPTGTTAFTGAVGGTAYAVNLPSGSTADIFNGKLDNANRLRILSTGTIESYASDGIALRNGSGGAFMLASGGGSGMEFYTQYGLYCGGWSYGNDASIIANQLLIGTNTSIDKVRLLCPLENSLQMGTNHATTATHQTFKAHDVTTGTGADLILKGGTGSVADGYVKIGASTGGLAFFGAGGSLLISGNTSTNISSAGAGNPLLDDTQSDGGLAGGAYTFGGLVAALKSYGIIG